MYMPSTPIPVAFVVADSDSMWIDVFRGDLNQDYDVVQTSDISSAPTSLLMSCGGDLQNPELDFGVGSNAAADPKDLKAPRAIITDPNVTEEQVTMLEASFNGTRAIGIPVVRMMSDSSMGEDEVMINVLDELNALVENGTIKAE